MASSFAEKQQWVALLEAVTSSNKNSKQMADASVLGNVICRMSSRDDRRMDIMCTWPLSDNVSVFRSCSSFLLHILHASKHTLLSAFDAAIGDPILSRSPVVIKAHYHHCLIS